MGNGLNYYIETCNTPRDYSSASAHLVMFDDDGVKRIVQYRYGDSTLSIDFHEVLVFDDNHYIVATSSHIYDGEKIMHC